MSALETEYFPKRCPYCGEPEEFIFKLESEKIVRLQSTSDEETLEFEKFECRECGREIIYSRQTKEVIRKAQSYEKARYRNKSREGIWELVEDQKNI